MDKLILGRYIPGNSMIHRLDPRSKLLAMFAFLLLIFWANNLITNVLIIAFVFAMVLLSQIRSIFFINGLKPMIGLFCLQPFSKFSSHLEQVFCGNFGFLRFRLKA